MNEGAVAGTVAIRADSGVGIGSGHIVRCLTLGSELRARGAGVTFMCAERAGNQTAMAERSGFAVKRLTGREDDPAGVIAALGGHAADWVVSDHYGLGEQWESAIRPHAARLLAIDDLADRLHRCDVLLDQNYAGSGTSFRYDGLVPDGTRRLLGPRYALLQRAYAEAGASRPKRTDGARVLVFFGATDPTDETGKALDALADPSLADLSVDVVVGANHPDPSGIRARAAARGRTTVHDSVPSLAPLMARADVAVGAGGTTTWERMCSGVRSVVVTIAAHQEPFARILAGEGYIRLLGAAPHVRIADYVRGILAETVSAPADLPPLVDGFGARRVAEVLMPSGRNALELRRARPEDAGVFFDWRNEEGARAMSFSTDPVSWPVHRAWFADRLTRQDSELWVMHAGGLPVGQFRLDRSGHETVLSYAVDSLVRGRGWGTWLVSAAMARAAEFGTGLRAGVRAENDASRRIFQRLGWREHQASDGSIEFRR